jgi:NADPH:quinone reductase-like Zn-dependent oxidoreductase
MRVVVCDEAVGEAEPRHWVSSTQHSVEGRPVRFGVAEVPDTAFNAAGDYNRYHVLIRVLGFSLNFRDTALLLGEHPPGAHDRSRGIGSDYVAEVVATGAEVTDLEVGQRVIPAMDWPPTAEDPFAVGVVSSTASRELQRVHRSRLVPVPPAMSDAEAAAFSVSAQTSYAMLRRAEVGAGSTVLVTAATSATSRFVVSAARGRGARVFCLSRSGRGAEVAASSGAEGAFDVSSAGDVQALSALARRLHGFDAVVDPFCDAYLTSTVRLLGFGGHYVTCRLGARSGDHDADGAGTPSRWLEMLSSAVSKNVTIHGQCLGTRADLERALEDWTRGSLRVPLDSVHRGGDLAAFVRRTLDPVRRGKVVYLFDQPDTAGQGSGDAP